MKLRRILSVLLTLCLLTTFLPPRTVAAQTEKHSSPYTSVRNSAFYPTIDIQEVTPEPEKAPGESDNIWNNTEHYAAYYVSADQAALQLRNHMKNRKTNFDLYVKFDTSDYEKLTDELLNKAAAHTGNPIEGDYLLWHCTYWGGQVEEESLGSNYGFHFTVEMKYSTTIEQEQELTKAVNNLLNILNVYNKSDYEKVKTVYDYICQNITYDYEHLDDPNYTLMFSAYAALINKTTVCQGYATLFYRLLLTLGVDCRVITGVTSSGEAHAWNIVKLGSVYYNLDSTWDAENNPYMFFLRNSEMNATHHRDLECSSTQFHQDHPMSATDYAEGVDGKPEYIFVSGTCGVDVYWAIDRDGKLTIFGDGAVENYSSSSDLGQTSPWTYWKDAFDTVIVEEGIVKLGNYLFNGFDQLVNVTLPESLVIIGNDVFRQCVNLAEIHIPDKVRSIGSGAFSSCYNLHTVTLGKSLKTIEHGAFFYCSGLKEIRFPDSLEKIGGAAFQYCSSLTELTIPANVASVEGFSYCTNLQVLYVNNSIIGAYAFSGCSALHTVVLSDQVTTIDLWSFAECTSLKTITIPKSVTYIGLSPFKACTALEEVYFVGDAPGFVWEAFESTTTTAYYPAGNPTWTEDVLQDYGGDITWVPYCPGHEYESAVTPVSCTVDGYITYTCIHCDESYKEDIPALGHQWSEGSCDQPRSCTVCGESSGANGHVYDDGVDGTCNFCNIDRVETVDRIVVHMFRMYNPNTGEHFYTGSEEERDNLIGHGWQYEGIGFTFPANTGVPVHRLFHEPTGEHLYTMDEEEKARLTAEGWNYEGVAFNSAYDTEAVQYRLYNPNTTVGAYHFTHSDEERQNLLDAGWQDQGIGWYSCWK